MRIGNCKRCKREFKADDPVVDVFNYPFQTWFKLCPVCYEIELYSGHLDLCNLDIEGKIGEGGV